jgi:hypothetical protein
LFGDDKVSPLTDSASLLAAFYHFVSRTHISNIFQDIPENRGATANNRTGAKITAFAQEDPTGNQCRR